MRLACDAGLWIRRASWFFVVFCGFSLFSTTECFSSRPLAMMEIIYCQEEPRYRRRSLPFSPTTNSLNGNSGIKLVFLPHPRRQWEWLFCFVIFRRLFTREPENSSSETNAENIHKNTIKTASGKFFLLQENSSSIIRPKIFSSVDFMFFKTWTRRAS